jgi:hypothetical protein
MLASQRKILRAAPGAFTNAPAARITAAEALAQQQRDNADLWIPLKPHLLEAATNEQTRVEIETLIRDTNALMRDAAACFDNLDPAAVEPARAAEDAPYQLWFITAEPPALVDEDIQLQTNALVSAGVPFIPTRADQPEALRLTQRFRETFPQWADEYQQAAQANTNMPALTVEARVEIETLAVETEGLQFQAVLINGSSPDGGVLPDPSGLQTQALANLQRIKELLPKESNPPPQQPPQPNGQPQDQNPDENPQPDDPQPDDPESNPPPKPEPKEQPDSRTSEKTKEMLRRAIEREQQHEADKQKQLQNSRPPDGAPDY